MPQDHTQLEVYNRAYAFALDIYKATTGFPKEEIFGITSQLRRAASSIGANISEGCGRKTDKDFANFLHISMGSIKECEHFLKLAAYRLHEPTLTTPMHPVYSYLAEAFFL